MSAIEYKVIVVPVPFARIQQWLNRLNATEDWELVSFFRTRPTKDNPYGVLIACFKRDKD